MDKFIIEGGRPLKGKIAVEGVKNVILPMMCAALMADTGKTVIGNVPRLQDIRVLRRLLNELGAVCEFDESNKSVTIDASSADKTVASYELVKQMRASFLLSGAMLGRFGEFHISLPGGCAIGARPVNFHMAGFRRMGATVMEKEGLLSARAPRLSGATICLDYPSHTGTENLMMAAVLADGTTVVENAACEPEIQDFGDFLNAMGARVSGHGTPTIIIEGVKKLNAVSYTPITDRIVAGTYMYAAAVTAGEIEIEGVRPESLRIVIDKLVEMGVVIEFQKNGNIVVKGPKKLTAVDVTTMPHPGFPTDLQPPFMACLAVADGVSFVRETVFENRFIHAAELNRMGANIRVAGDKAVIVGVPSLIGAPVMASDLRAGAALVLAGLAAKGTTVVDRVYHIDRGYENLEKKLASLGAAIRRES
ncbi:MAG: UDP-N-acetylglucosamine 1-carboxyvinyltransferase [Candidatus Latescibacteria bacterium]|nr:UDP-N-acetylglucosamine 1-carboxyvinyltransferase [Candidatus Latescibacterota bacterium]